MKEILFVIFFSSMLFLSINSVNAANDRLDWNNCADKNHERTPLKKIGSDRLYCVTTETAEKLIERGWGTLTIGYFATIQYTRDCSHSKRGDVVGVLSEKTSEIFDWITAQCQSYNATSISGEPNFDCSFYDCTLTFYNGTIYKQIDDSKKLVLVE